MESKERYEHRIKRKSKMSNQSQNDPNWKKGDIVVLFHYGCIFEAEHDPKYCSTIFSSEDWHYGLTKCKEIRLATIEDVDKKIEYQTKIVEREQATLDRLIDFSKRVRNEPAN
jgi:hypothetical protein